MRALLSCSYFKPAGGFLCSRTVQRIKGADRRGESERERESGGWKKGDDTVKRERVMMERERDATKLVDQGEAD